MTVEHMGNIKPLPEQDAVAVSSRGFPALLECLTLERASYSQDVFFCIRMCSSSVPYRGKHRIIMPYFLQNYKHRFVNFYYNRVEPCRSSTSRYSLKMPCITRSALLYEHSGG